MWEKYFFWQWDLMSVLEEGGRGENAVKMDKAYERVERKEWAWEMKRETRKWSCSRP